MTKRRKKKITVPQGSGSESNRQESAGGQAILAGREGFLSSEKEIIRRWIQRDKPVDGKVSRFEPPRYRNPVDEARIGRYRKFESKICVTAELDVISLFLEKGYKVDDLPGFPEAGPRQWLYFDPETVQAAIVTAGGVAPGLNTVIHSIVNMHTHPELYQGQPVYGFLDGFQGLARRSRMCRQYWQELTYENTADWIHKGGTELGTGTREPADVEAIIQTLNDNGVNILYVVGGNGSLRVAHLLAERITERGLEIVVAGIPKTMDNDILWVDRSFGFDTAVEEATRAVVAIHADTKATGRICLMQLFGRDAGFVAAHATLASGVVDAVLVPEVPFNIKPLLDYIENVVRTKGHALVVVAEGAAPLEYDENYVRERIEEEGLDPNDRTNPRVNELYAEGKMLFLKDKCDESFSLPNGFRGGRHRVFVNQPRHLIRAVPASASDQIYCRRLADMAVHNALAGFTNFMISQWLTEYVLVPLKLVVGNTKKIPSRGVFWTTVTHSTGQPSFLEDAE